MNPNPTRKDREYRQIANFELRALPDETEGREQLYVEGHAAVFERPTVLWEYDGIEYKEQIARGAFDEADMSDVIFVYNHGGKVMARTRNNTLELRVDNTGLFMRARLDGTQEGRTLYEEIKGGYIDRMSFAFVVRESSYDRDLRLRTITKFKKIYDVSAVSYPAYDDATISARSFFELQREQEEKEKQRRRRLILVTYV